MTDNFNRGTGGASKRISARPSIHSHRTCTIGYTEAMGRHGLTRSNRQDARAPLSEQGNTNSNGYDEVDNSFSKPAYPVSPSFDRRNFNRSNSLEKDNLDTEDSDDSDEESIRGNINSATSSPSAKHGTPTNRNTSAGGRNSQISDSPLETSQRFNRSRSVASHSHQQPITPRVLQSTRTDDPQSSLNVFWLIAIVVCVIVGVGAKMLNITNVSNSVIYDEDQFYDDMEHLGNKYSIDEDAVLKMQTGIATIFKKQDAGSFMFVYNSNGHKFDQNIINKYVNDVAVTASKYLRNESTPVHYTSVEGSQLHMSGHGELVSRFRDDLDKTGAMVVKHVESIPSALAMAFHYYCDEYNPLVKKSAIFFTLNLAKCDNTDKETSHAVIEKCLAKKWDGVAADSIGPLLTRVVNVVIDLTSLFN